MATKQAAPTPLSPNRVTGLAAAPASPHSAAGSPGSNGQQPSVTVKEAIDVLLFGDVSDMQFKKLVFELQGIVSNHSDFAEEFLDRAGLQLIVDLVKKASGSSVQSHLLLVLKALLNYVNAIEAVKEQPELVDKIYHLLAPVPDGGPMNVNVIKATLEVLIVICHVMPNGRELIHDSAKRRAGLDSKPYALLAPYLTSPDLLCVRNTLLFMNVMLKKAREAPMDGSISNKMQASTSGAAADHEAKNLVFRWKEAGLLNLLKALTSVDDAAVKQQLALFQKQSEIVVPRSWESAEKYRLMYEDMRKRYELANESLFIFQQQQAKVKLLKLEFQRAQETLKLLGGAVPSLSRHPHPTKRFEHGGGLSIRDLTNPSAGGGGDCASTVAAKGAGASTTTTGDLTKNLVNIHVPQESVKEMTNIRKSILQHFLTSVDIRSFAEQTLNIQVSANASRTRRAGGSYFSNEAAMYNDDPPPPTESDEMLPSEGEDSLPPSDLDSLPPSDDEDGGGGIKRSKSGGKFGKAGAAAVKGKKAGAPAAKPPRGRGGRHIMDQGFPPSDDDFPDDDFPSDDEFPDEEGNSKAKGPKKAGGASALQENSASGSGGATATTGTGAAATHADPAAGASAATTATAAGTPATAPAAATAGFAAAAAAAAAVAATAKAPVAAPVVKAAAGLPVLGGPKMPVIGKGGPAIPLGGKGVAAPADTRNYFTAFTPDKKMRPLHWDKIPLASLEGTVWERIHNGGAQKINATFDYSEFESMFSQKEVVKEEKRKKEDEKPMLVDPKTFMNFSIMLHKLPPIPTIMRAINELDTQTLKRDQIQALLAASEEKAMPLDLTNNFRAKQHTKAVEDYSPPEQFVAMVLSMGDLFKPRLSAWSFTLSWQESMATLRAPLVRASLVMDAVLGSNHLPYVLAVLLGFGNLMNHGTPKGNAPAIMLSVLGKLDAAKDNRGKVSLMQHLLNTIRQQNPAALELAEELRCMWQENGGAQSLKLDDMEKSVSEAAGQLNMFNAHCAAVKRLMANDPMAGSDPFGPMAAQYAVQAEADLNEAKRLLEAAKGRYKNVVKYFGYPEKRAPKLEEIVGELAAFVAKVRKVADDAAKDKRKVAMKGKKLDGKGLDNMVGQLQEQMVHS